MEKRIKDDNSITISDPTKYRVAIVLYSLVMSLSVPSIAFVDIFILTPASHQ